MTKNSSGRNFLKNIFRFNYDSMCNYQCYPFYRFCLKEDVLSSIWNWPTLLMML